MGGTGKAEDAKLPGAGISLKQCPRKWEAGKGGVSVLIWWMDRRSRLTPSQIEELVPVKLPFVREIPPATPSRKTEISQTFYKLETRP